MEVHSKATNKGPRLVFSPHDDPNEAQATGEWISIKSDAVVRDLR